MNQSLAVETRNKVAKVYLGGMVVFSVFIALVASVIVIVSRTV
jgi:hypothetical protein